ncbi:hypothetical protein EVAR_45602_1 [Eumeta japonica]|uniref:Uncharacterized protein n=1 Tax=Eumeta variegata TaxID=151549 RepID=A0A4C1YTP1_EUMVA|nr:hypothetical protein EVAR_45602_1 [Eumeta japonica]
MSPLLHCLTLRFKNSEETETGENLRVKVRAICATVRAGGALTRHATAAAAIVRTRPAAPFALNSSDVVAQKSHIASSVRLGYPKPQIEASLLLLVEAERRKITVELVREL